MHRKNAFTMSPPDPENISSLTCESCFKSYDRRDLLMRHRRRCKGPQKSSNRRKACNACVQAKTKCCYTQPTCTRCSKRGIQCVYDPASVISARDPTEQDQTPVEESPEQSLQSSSHQDGSLTPTANPYDLELSNWDSSVSPFPSDAFDITMTDLINPSATFPDFTSGQSALVPRNENSTHSNQTANATSGPENVNLLSFPSNAWGLPPAREAQRSRVTPPSSSKLNDHVRLLSKYPSFLLKDGSCSPFLHHSLYSDAVPDITFLPLTSMAVCCGSGMNLSDRPPFFRRAMDAERQRIIGTFPSYECMQQWDALHAMLIYEDLDLRESTWDELELWKHNPRSKGLRSPFLLKMIRSYTESYPEICNPDIDVFSDPQSVLNSSNNSTWSRWVKTETARRTIFFANMLNFYTNREHHTGNQLPYYEPVSNELILNMPLPCTEAAWTARNEEDWRSAMYSSSSTIEETSVSSKVSLNSIFAQFNRENIQVECSRSIGFNNSNQLRNLIILCASEQYI